MGRWARHPCVVATASPRSAEFAGKPGEVRIFDAAPIRAVMVDGEGPVGEAAFAPRMPGL